MTTSTNPETFQAKFPKSDCDGVTLRENDKSQTSTINCHNLNEATNRRWFGIQGIYKQVLKNLHFARWQMMGKAGNLGINLNFLILLNFEIYLPN